MAIENHHNDAESPTKRRKMHLNMGLANPANVAEPVSRISTMLQIMAFCSNTSPPLTPPKQTEKQKLGQTILVQ